MSVVIAKFAANLNLTQTPAAGYLSGQALTVPEALAVSLANGAGVDAINLIACQTLTLLASTPQTLDLTSMTDVQGNAVSLAKVRLVIIRNNATTDGFVVVVGNAAATVWSAVLGATGTLTVFPGTAANPNGGFAILSMPGLTAGTVDSTHKLLKFDPGSNAMTVDVILCGA